MRWGKERKNKNRRRGWWRRGDEVVLLFLPSTQVGHVLLKPTAAGRCGEKGAFDVKDISPRKSTQHHQQNPNLCKLQDLIAKRQEQNDTLRNNYLANHCQKQFQVFLGKNLKQRFMPELFQRSGLKIFLLKMDKQRKISHSPNRNTERSLKSQGNHFKR